jgi:hypothetical protein
MLGELENLWRGRIARIDELITHEHRTDQE